MGSSLDVRNSSTVTISGGEVKIYLVAEETSKVRMYAGTVGWDLLAYDGSEIEIAGRDFKVDGVPVPYGPLSARTGTLTGTLVFGDPINNSFCQGGGDCTGTIILAAHPEPIPTLPQWGLVMLGLLLLTAMALALTRQRTV